MARVRENKPHEERRISNSAIDVLLQCQFKYLKQYIEQAPIDADAKEDTSALRMGSAHHSCLEWSNHQAKNFTLKMFEDACNEQNLDQEESYIVMAMVQSYLPVRERSKLWVIACEVEVGNEWFVGYIDMILTDVNGWWYIGDLKTASSVKDTLFAKLAANKQLNLYAYFVKQVADKLKLDMKKFAGVRYNVCVKPKIVIKQGESALAYGNRVHSDVYEIFIPLSLLKTADMFAEAAIHYKTAHSLTPATACRNRESCLDFFRPCPYWSHCHPASFTGCTEMVQVSAYLSNKGILTNTMVDQTLPPLETDGLLL